ncbi:unnamed protein product [Rotaria sp. Silwood1]|nr:unnamed protein product [Rotaria sp. Silwood1]CAF1659030.1 unnamed protein product [Rotaria sp. Silwood1]CAF3853119.1 unnamed protein product [Rotaria sp. Silwood1]CAF3889324.1 unnamed protein product [Rotaria sp. Silwood1]CAF4930463.1 unnamed protein product [Rotaria sp. Silwood1]
MSDNQLTNKNDDDIQISVEATEETFDISVEATEETFDTSVEATEETFDTSVETTDATSDTTALSQNETPEQVQRRTFSHSPHSPEFIDQLCKAGFYYCNVRDRVICLSCGLVCEQWISHVDDPCETHRILSPNCTCVQSKLKPSGPSPPPPVINTNLSPTVNVAPFSQNILPSPNSLHHHGIVPKSSQNPEYSEIPKRLSSFDNWPSENLPSVDDLVQAGFFYTGKKTIVTCFYCNGSFQSFGPKDNPMIEHARWFPHCAYARQLCGDDLYRRVQESQRPRQEGPKANEWRENNSESRSDTNTLTNNRLLLIPNDDILSRLVTARLNLPISQRLINENFTLPIVKRCWEDQLRIKEARSREALAKAWASKNVITSTSVNTSNYQCHIEAAATGTSSSKSVHHATLQPTAIATEPEGSPDNPMPSNLCVLCFTEEKRLACIPCGHLATCVPCGHLLRLCPICRCDIKAFARIYI